MRPERFREFLCAALQGDGFELGHRSLAPQPYGLAIKITDDRVIRVMLTHRRAPGDDLEGPETAVLGDPDIPRLPEFAPASNVGPLLLEAWTATAVVRAHSDEVAAVTLYSMRGRQFGFRVDHYSGAANFVLLDYDDVHDLPALRKGV